VRQEEPEKMREEAETLDNGAIEMRAHKRARKGRRSVRAYTTSPSIFSRRQGKTGEEQDDTPT
jgi:hypothetical protein